MWPTLLLLPFFTPVLRAETDTGNSTSIPSIPTTRIDEELAKIAATCVSERNYQQLLGNNIKGTLGEALASLLIREALQPIGLSELRSTLNFAPLGAWKKYNRTYPSEEELSSAPTVEAYYNLKEPRSSESSLDSRNFFEHNMITGIAYLDKKVPSIRTIFKLKYEEFQVQNPELAGRKLIDRLIDAYSETASKIKEAIGEMQLHSARRKCYESLED